MHWTKVWNETTLYMNSWMSKWIQSCFLLVFPSQITERNTCAKACQGACLHANLQLWILYFDTAMMDSGEPNIASMTCVLPQLKVGVTAMCCATYVEKYVFAELTFSRWIWGPHKLKIYRSHFVFCLWFVNYFLENAVFLHFRSYKGDVLGHL